MAEGKKSIVVYSDWDEYFNDLTDEEAGKLIKHFFAYVNDENPILNDRVLEMAFKPIKNQLKRDLEKWEETKRKRSESGKAGGLRSGEVRKQNEANEANASTFKQNEANEAVNDNVIICNSVLDVNDSVNVNENVILLKKETKTEKFVFKSEMIKYGFDSKLVDEWLLIRKNKKATNTQTAFEQFIKEIETRHSNINEVLKIIVTNSWSGFKYSWIDNIKNDSNGKSGNTKSTGNTNAEQKQSAIDAVNALYGR